MGESSISRYGLHDIDPLPIPLESNTAQIVIAFILLALLSVISVTAINRYRSRRHQAARQLRRLKKTMLSRQHKACEQKQFTYKIAQHVSFGLGKNGILSTTLLPADLAEHALRWEMFIDDLSRARYAREAVIENGQMLHLVDESLFWIKNWP